jgi:hypothetical protein
MKDGGPESSVTGYWLVELKGLFSIVLLRFEGASRPVFHTHAFNCLSWVLKGILLERSLTGGSHHRLASWRPFVTRREDFHKVDSIGGSTWVLSFRGPWAKRWHEYRPDTDQFVTLESGRRVVPLH